MRIEPCPFCGCDEPSYIAEKTSGCVPTHWYECRRCMARGPYIRAEHTDDPQLQALAQWNLRATPTTGSATRSLTPESER